MTNVVKAFSSIVVVSLPAPLVMTSQKQTESKPLLVEVTPKIASDILVILKHMPKTEIEPTLEEVVAAAVSYFRIRLDSGEVQLIDDGQQALSE